MKFPKEKIVELKKSHGDIFQAMIQYKNEDGEKKKIEFIHRKPTFEDYENVQKDAAEQGGAVANLNLVAGIVLEPAPSQISAEITLCPMAVEQWITKTIRPFFGGDVVEVSSKKL